MVPINITSERCQELANILGCKTEGLPFSYLGLPMGTTRPKVEDLIYLATRADKRLSGIANLLSYSSRLMVIKATISAMPIFAMCTLMVHYTILDHVEKSCRTFLWNNKDIHKSGKCLAKWDTVCLPKKNGGLGVLSLRTQNKALMIKFLYKFYNNKDIPWVQLIWEAHYKDDKVPIGKSAKGSFWWRDCTKLIDTYKQHASCSVKKGNSAILWKDKLEINGVHLTMQERFPQLHSFAKNTDISVRKAVITANENIQELFHNPMSVIAMQQRHELEGILDQYSHEEDFDIWSFEWGKCYSTKKMYEAILDPPDAPVPFKWIWKSCCLSKHKFFFWLLLLDRLNTKDLMNRKHFYVEDSYCVLCQHDQIESLAHLFFECEFSKAFWNKILFSWDTNMDLIEMLIDGKRRQNIICFKETLLVGCWSLWNHRNKIIFDNESIDQDRCLFMFKESFFLIMHRAKPSLREGMQQWLDSL